MTIQVSPSPVPNSSTTDKLASALLDKDAYLSGLLKNVENLSSSLSSSANSNINIKSNLPWLQELKDNAAKWVRHSSLPSTREEEWRFTNLSELREIEFSHVDGQIISLEEINTLPETPNSRLVFVNGIYAPKLSQVGGLPDGVVVSNLTNLSEAGHEKVKHYLAHSEGSSEVFTALNTAGIQDVAVILVSKNVVVDTPISLVYLSVGNKDNHAIAEDGFYRTIAQPRCLVVAESGSQVNFIEEFGYQETQNANKEIKEAKEQTYFCNSVTEIWVEENAGVTHTRVTLEGAGAFHIGKTAVTQERYSRYTCNAVTIGGKLSRHNLEVLQSGEQTETTLNGLSVIFDKQLADTHSAIALNYPHGITNQLHKTIVGDKAHGVFNGKVFVPKPAQLTNAAQLNRNLLLSPKARIDTKPQLEITADNVKCAHGATVSQLEDDEIFYLQSRGIDENAARHLLINAFAGEIIDKIPVASLQERLMETVKSVSG
ncbi:MAG: Fe-S cluster assembly protein SufD [Cyanobacteria bacterium P01_A01_bin.84]